MINIIAKNKNIILLSIGILLIMLSIFLLLYDKFELLKSNVFDEVEMEKYIEQNKNNQDNNNEIINQDEIVEGIETEYVEESNTTKTNTNNSTSKKNTGKEAIGYLEINKINLKQSLYSKNSYYNNVNRGIQILSASDYPDKEGGNTILASHSGTSSISHFKHLYKLELNDEAKIYYKGFVYTYKISSIYNVPKTGEVIINRDRLKTSLTLITCTKDSKTEQTVYILYLVSKESGA